MAPSTETTPLLHPAVAGAREAEHEDSAIDIRIRRDISDLVGGHDSDDEEDFVGRSTFSQAVSRRPRLPSFALALPLLAHGRREQLADRTLHLCLGQMANSLGDLIGTGLLARCAAYPFARQSMTLAADGPHAHALLSRPSTAPLPSRTPAGSLEAA